MAAIGIVEVNQQSDDLLLVNFSDGTFALFPRMTFFNCNLSAGWLKGMWLKRARIIDKPSK
jgi:hypothetical protein